MPAQSLAQAQTFVPQSAPVVPRVDGPMSYETIHNLSVGEIAKIIIATNTELTRNAGKATPESLAKLFATLRSLAPAIIRLQHDELVDYIPKDRLQRNYLTVLDRLAIRADVIGAHDLVFRTAQFALGVGTGLVTSAPPSGEVTMEKWWTGAISDAGRSIRRLASHALFNMQVISTPAKIESLEDRSQRMRADAHRTKALRRMINAYPHLSDAMRPYNIDADRCRAGQHGARLTTARRHGIRRRKNRRLCRIHWRNRYRAQILPGPR